MRLAYFKDVLEGSRKELADLDPALIRSGDAVELFKVFDAIERTYLAAKTLVTARATDAGDWKKEGHRSPASWVADKTGSGVGQAISLLETSEQCMGLTETSDAVRRGELSGPQLKAIASTATQNPAAESELLKKAQSTGLKGLKEECGRIKARALSEKDAEARYENIRKNRSVHMWTDQDGFGRLEAKLTPDDFARVQSSIRTESNVIFNEARKAGHRESGLAYDADALVALITGTAATGSRAPSSTSSSSDTPTGKAGRGKSTRPTTLMHLRVDLAALRRGALEGQEVCEIPGVGPVPLATAVSEFGNAILKVVISDGVDVTTICHLGRTIPAHIRTALEDRDEKCVVPACDVARGLQIDHYQIDFHKDGPTELWNLCRLCRWHHYLKTWCGYAIVGEPGRWEWNGPESEENPVLTA
jgi:hypothetical protein